MQQIEEQIKQIMSSIQCAKNFKCCTDGFAAACRVKDIGIESLLECLEPTPRNCQYAMSFGYTYFCKCPLRLFLFGQQKAKTGNTKEK